jgi:hypothetical protein
MITRNLGVILGLRDFGRSAKNFGRSFGAAKFCELRYFSLARLWSA